MRKYKDGEREMKREINYRKIAEGKSRRRKDDTSNRQTELILPLTSEL